MSGTGATQSAHPLEMIIQHAGTAVPERSETNL